MSEYYVSGCKSHDDDIVTCDDSEAQFWTIYKRDSNGLSQGIVDFTMREDANAAMEVYAERDALQQQLNAVVAESAARGDIVERLIGQYSAAGYHAVQNSLNPAQSLLYDAMQVMKAVNTDAILNALRAEGVEMFADERDELRKHYVADKNREMAIAADHCSMVARHFANQLRAADAVKGGE